MCMIWLCNLEIFTKCNKFSVKLKHDTWNKGNQFEHNWDFFTYSMKLNQTEFCQITSLCHVKDLIWMLRHFNVLRTKTWKMKENISIVLNLVACKLPLFYISRCSFTENLLHFVKFQDSTIKSCTFCNYFILNCWRARIKFYTNCLFVN